ncbi:hypothetical protein TL16_g09345 [Triparma laevis f. inornata]|nr:hypothetical protein TL16_g09345 [Triparma laevis f. inornata]
MLSRYLCGDHPDCIVNWHEVDEENHVQMVGKLVERGKMNLKDKILFVGVTERMEESMEILESLLPTYFESITSSSLALSISSKKTNSQKSFERNFKQGSAVNVAPDYKRVKEDEREVILKRNICYADFKVYNYAVEVLEERYESWKRRDVKDYNKKCEEQEL